MKRTLKSLKRAAQAVFDRLKSVSNASDVRSHLKCLELPRLPLPVESRCCSR